MNCRMIITIAVMTMIKIMMNCRMIIFITIAVSIKMLI